MAELDFIGTKNLKRRRKPRSRRNGKTGAIALADMVKTTLGPKGMDKILKPATAGPKDSNITITNDGATILSKIHIDNAAAKILIDISKIQDQEVGDGTTSVCVLAGEMLRQAEKLVMQQKIHPQIIIKGWRKARDVAKSTLIGLSIDNSDDSEQFKKDLMNIARTTISSKLLTQEKEHFAKLAVDAVLRLNGSTNLELIQIIKKSGGTMKDSYLDEGFILEKTISVGCPRRVENARILVANTPMDYDKVKIYGMKVEVDEVEKVAEIEQAEREKMKDKVEDICSYKPTVFINRQLVYNYPEQLFADKGIMCIEHADFEGVERLANATGGEILSTFKSPDRADAVLGEASIIEEIMIGEDKVIKFSGCKKGEACTLILRGSSKHLLDEAERSMHDALCVLVKTIQNKKVIYGGGNSEIRMALAVEELAKKINGKESLAVKGFAEALRSLPAIIADNGGYDSSELVQNMTYEIGTNDHETYGLDMYNGKVDCMKEKGIRECLRVKEQVLISACEASEMILRCDSMITCAPRRRDKMGLHN